MFQTMYKVVKGQEFSTCEEINTQELHRNTAFSIVIDTESKRGNNLIQKRKIRIKLSLHNN